MTNKNMEAVAKAIYWAAHEMYPPAPNDPATGFVNLAHGLDKERAWSKTSEAHRHLCRLQAQRAIESIREIQRSAAR